MRTRFEPASEPGEEGIWYVELDTTFLTPGAYYRFCTDFDGTGTDLPFGDTLLEFYVGRPRQPTKQREWRREQCTRHHLVMTARVRYFAV